ncbi:MAG: 16S rRNA processing protein RimM [Oscillospiraceae bacterium]|nr:16S rRNA processing protein RimM [Oscillospiraceae bacterium]
MQKYLEAGKIVSTHGVNGELKVYPWADSASALNRIRNVFWDQSGTDSTRVISARVHKNMLLLRLEGVESIEDAHRFIDRTIFADRDEIIRKNGTYFVVDLLGLEVVDSTDGSRIGTVCDVTNTGSQDLYHVKLDSGEVRMVPAVPAFIKSVDLEAGKITVEPIKGLFNDAD